MNTLPHLTGSLIAPSFSCLSFFLQQEFFTSPEHFQSQLEGQLKDLEAVVEQLLPFGKEDVSLLDHTLQQLKNTCHVTCSRVGGPIT